MGMELNRPKREPVYAAGGRDEGRGGGGGVIQVFGAQMVQI